MADQSDATKAIVPKKSRNQAGCGFAMRGAHLGQQPVVASRQLEDAHVDPTRPPCAHEALEQPCAVGVELHHRLQADGRRTGEQARTRCGLDEQL